MLRVDNEMVCPFDVDDTLVIWDRQCDSPGEGRIQIEDPYGHFTVFLKPHTQHVRLLKQMKARGRYVIVWSGGGNLWAEAVIKALKLERYVDLVLTKPITYVDDLTCDKWMGSRIYMSPEGAE